MTLSGSLGSWVFERGVTRIPHKYLRKFRGRLTHDVQAVPYQAVECCQSWESAGPPGILVVVAIVPKALEHTKNRQKGDETVLPTTTNCCTQFTCGIFKLTDELLDMSDHILMKHSIVVIWRQKGRIEVLVMQ